MEKCSGDGIFVLHLFSYLYEEQILRSPCPCLGIFFNCVHACICDADLNSAGKTYHIPPSLALFDLFAQPVVQDWRALQVVNDILFPLLSLYKAVKKSAMKLYYELDLKNRHRIGIVKGMRKQKKMQ